MGANEVLVEPQYGFGWTSRSGEPAEVPKVFKLLAEELSPGLLFGSVETKPHVLAGHWVALVRRTTGRAPTFNVYVFFERPEDVTAAISADSPVASLTGFAMLASRAGWLRRLLSRRRATK